MSKRNTVHFASDGSNNSRIGTGLPSLDMTLSGGYPRGAVTEIFGAEEAGKSTLALGAARHAQKCGLLTLYIDSEFRIQDQGFLTRRGIDPERFLLYHPESAEDAFEAMRISCENASVGLVVLDTLGGLSSTLELPHEKRGSHLAETVSGALRHICRAAARNRVCVLVTNQMRTQAGVLFGDSTVTPGGRAIRHHASLRLRLKRTGYLNFEARPIGTRNQCEVVKGPDLCSRVATRTGLLFSNGVSALLDTLLLGERLGIAVPGLREWLVDAEPVARLDGSGIVNVKETAGLRTLLSRLCTRMDKELVDPSPGLGDTATWLRSLDMGGPQSFSAQWLDLVLGYGLESSQDPRGGEMKLESLVIGRRASK